MKEEYFGEAFALSLRELEFDMDSYHWESARGQISDNWSTNDRVLVFATVYSNKAVGLCFGAMPGFQTPMPSPGTPDGIGPTFWSQLNYSSSMVIYPLEMSITRTGETVPLTYGPIVTPFGVDSTIVDGSTGRRPYSAVHPVTGELIRNQIEPVCFV